MTRAFRCDRCHTYDVGDPVIKVQTIASEGPNKMREYELCPQCLASLHDWLEAERASHG